MLKHPAPPEKKKENNINNIIKQEQENNKETKKGKRWIMIIYRIKVMLPILEEHVVGRVLGEGGGCDEEWYMCIYIYIYIEREGEIER